jgi:phosphoribosylformylglycinamidine synthase II/formyltetrahydrofolate-dependent phosphoribosylglycinamide formyltransferase
MKNISIFASGSGSNALNLIRASQGRSDILISCVIVDTLESSLPKTIKEKFPHVPVKVILSDKFSKAEFEGMVLKVLKEAGVEWILLAGFMKIIGPTLLKAYKDKIINIHPSLLPLYPGINSYQRAFEEGVSSSGVTIHLVDQGIDTGPILLQESFPRLTSDTLTSFVERGKEVEWKLYPRIYNSLSTHAYKYCFTLYSQGRSEAQIYWLVSPKHLSISDLEEVSDRIGDSVDQKVFINDSYEFNQNFKSLLPLKVTHFRPGVTDNAANSVHELLISMNLFKDQKLEVHSGTLGQHCDFNPLIQEQITVLTPAELQTILEVDFTQMINSSREVKTFPLLKASEKSLAQMSQDNCWALSLDEMKIIQEHFKQLGRNPTDVEIEMLAQTWSEHCKHKIFNAEIEYEDQEQKFTVNSLFKEFIKAPTYKMDKPWAISLFDDNAGVVRFREGMDLCIKVETHNSPSALDPYGGALTGILGVNRDIMGTGLGARPVANTNVFCVGMPDETDMPKALFHPSKILKGIHHGVQDGGNKSGIPTVNGAIYFDESYSGKPLVYCGTVGIIPPTIKTIVATIKGQRPGDIIVMVGGDVGIDGIHGATASSLVMDKSTTIGMVQIGDPFSQKRMLDFLLAARDELLYNSITDNGAGGLSSSVGEMSALTNGAHLKLEKVPLKYPGLNPWQILVSESQERMTLSVPPENWSALAKMAELFQVKITNIGEFTSNGKFRCTYGNETVCELKLSFLHDGLPKMKLKARHEGSFKSWKTKISKNISSDDHRSLMQELVSHPSLASKEKWIRQYDHEVQGATVIKPMEGLGETSPNDAGVLWYGAYGLDGNDGFAVASGLCPHFSIDDTYLMAKMAVDESVRNLLCHGVDPDKIALVDNFCWPDPTPSTRNPDAEFKLAQLVRSCMGLKEIIEIYKMPLVSGKDSMKNDYHGENVKISVLPTLLMTALGHVPCVLKLPRSQAKENELIYRLGLKDYHQYFGHFLHDLTQLDRNNKRDFAWDKIRSLYSRIFSAQRNGFLLGLHDVSEGGFLFTLFEFLMMNNLGINLRLQSGVDRTAFLYSELPGHFVVSVPKNKKFDFESHFMPQEWEFIGEVNTTGVIGMDDVSLSVCELTAKWRNV